MQFKDFFQETTSSISIVGTNPLIPHLEQSAQVLADLLSLNPDLTLTVLCESDSENFAQSLCVDTESSANRKSFAELTTHRDRILGRRANEGLLVDIAAELAGDPEDEGLLERVSIRQLNLRLPASLIAADGNLWYSITADTLPTIESYLPAEEGSKLHADLMSLVEFYTSPDRGGVYLSDPEEELLQLYDKSNYPRGIFPRACFYTTDFQRFSVWGFVFNRRGQLMLHQRSKHTKDGRLLWDKSVGGHVDLRDSSTVITAERELVEELFLPQAEYSKYMQEDIGDIVNFGDWNLTKRPERTFREAFSSLGESDWVIFRAVDDRGEPLAVTRVSERRMHDENGEVSLKRTVFRSDVYLFIAPPDYLDTEEQMDNLVGLAEQSGAAQDHRLLTPNELRRWIGDMEGQGTHRETFTDDLLYINLEHRALLEQFAEFVTYVSGAAG